MDNNEKNMDDHGTAAVIAFAKNPEIEPVKTRLALSVGRDAASAVFDALLTDCMTSLQRLTKVERFIACSPNSGHRFFKQLARDYSVGLVDQHGDCLGERMLNCVETHCGRYRPTVIVGTDVPILPIEEMSLEIAAFREWDVLLGPTFDGGYYLIAMSSSLPEVFEEVEWSTDRVLERTRENCARHNLKLRELPPALDVDDVGSLLYLVKLLEESPGEAKATSAVLSLLGLP